MSCVTNQMLNAAKETDCVAITSERKYYRIGETWVKRSLAPSEWQINPKTGNLVIPRYGRERALNEAASMKFIAEQTNIPVPKLHCVFEDREAVYLVMTYIEGVGMDSLNADERKVVEAQLDDHLAAMKQLKSNEWGGPSNIVLPPYRVMVKDAHADQGWNMKPSEDKDLVFCHNDLSGPNIIVDPKTLEIKAIIDWEYSGFFPKEFEREFFKRLETGPSVALGGEEDDVEILQDIMSKYRLDVS